MEMNLVKYITDGPTVNIIENYLDELNIFYNREEHTNTITMPTISLNKTAFIFFSNIYLYYHLNDQIYVDIEHIVSNLVSTEQQKNQIMRNYRDLIRHQFLVMSSNGRANQRNLIDIETMARIILSFNNPMSRRFLLECKFYLMIIYVALVNQLAEAIIDYD